MPIPKTATRGTYRRATKQRSRARVQARHEQQAAERRAVEEAARVEAEQQHAALACAYRLRDHMNAIVAMERELAALVEISTQEQRNELDRLLSGQYHRAREKLERYTNPWREDWIPSARDREEMHETIDRILVERGVKVHRENGRRNKTKERRLNDRRAALEDRLADDRAALDAYGDAAALARLGMSRTAGGVPVDRFHRELSRADIEADIAQIEQTLASMPTTEKRKPAEASRGLNRLDAIALAERRARQK